ncbi:MAG: preprotein translocase subunit SecE [Demequinaceae bacterium]|nr:preprotein translocase subunit SecE [Demequinaceae bacterium]
MSESSFTDAEEKDPRHESHEGRGFFGRPALFLRQVLSELKRVVTPSVEDWRRYTIVVAVFVLIIVAIVMALDLAFGQLAERALGD